MPRHAAAAFLKLHCLVEGCIFTAAAVTRTLLETSRAASTNFLSSTSLGWPTFFGFTSPLASFRLLSETYPPQPRVSHTLVTEQTVRAVVQRHPHLLLPWARAEDCNPLRAGSEVQQRHAGPQSVAKGSQPLPTTPRICGTSCSAFEQHGIP